RRAYGPSAAIASLQSYELENPWITSRPLCGNLAAPIPSSIHHKHVRKWKPAPPAKK
ncbi:hypothetical protein Bpfe_012973, partial [Biomphalaria pfeifferi]